jgi:hypothetical protein
MQQGTTEEREVHTMTEKEFNKENKGTENKEYDINKSLTDMRGMMQALDQKADGGVAAFGETPANEAKAPLNKEVQTIKDTPK